MTKVNSSTKYIKLFCQKLFYTALTIIIFATIITFELSEDRSEVSVLSLIYQLKKTSLNKKDMKIFVINLDRSTDRLEKVQKEFEKINLKFERFSAIDGYNIEITDNINGNHFFGKDIKENKNLISFDGSYNVRCPLDRTLYLAKKTTHAILSAGEFGVHCSHRGIWKKIVEQNISYALIFEDDVTFFNDFNPKFDNLLAKLPYQFDIIYLRGRPQDGKGIQYILNNYKLIKTYPDKKVVTSFAGYIISLDGAKKLLALSANFSFPIDLQPSHPNVITYYTRNDYLYAPEGISPDDSIIYQMGRPNY